MEKVAIIIVNWNTGSLLAKCLKSVHAASDRELISEVIVVDNASKDSSVAEAKNVHVDVPVKLIESSENLGFAGGNNRGIQELTDQDAHIFLLNPDTELKSGALTQMVETFKTDSAIGIVGPKLLNSDGTHQVSVRRLPSLPTFFIEFLKIKRLLGNTRTWKQYMAEDFSYTEDAEVEQVMGAAFLINNKLFKQIGSLDDGYFVWFEEVDYCKTAIDAGWKIWYTPRAQVVHHGGVSFHQLIGWRKSAPYVKSSLRYIRKHHGAAAWLLFVLFSPIPLLLSIPAGFLHQAMRERNKRRL